MLLCIVHFSNVFSYCTRAGRMNTNVDYSTALICNNVVNSNREAHCTDKLFAKIYIAYASLHFFFKNTPASLNQKLIILDYVMLYENYYVVYVLVCILKLLWYLHAYESYYVLGCVLKLLRYLYVLVVY